jgi:DNA-binding response OmpR family regulator
LTTLEKNIIEYMGVRRGQSVSRDELSRAFRLNGRGVDVAIARLRKKVGPRAIETVRNIGYRLA